MGVLLRKVNGVGRLVPQLHLDSSAGRGNGDVAVSEAPHKVEGFLDGFLQRQPQRIALHRGFHRGTHLRRRPKVPVRRHQAPDALVRPLKVVALNEERKPLLAVTEVAEDGAAEEFVPQRLPEAFHLPQRHRVVGPTLHMANSVLA
jgi:hypothetical protein